MSNDFRAEIDIGVKGVDSISAAQKATQDLDAALLKAAQSAQQLDNALTGTSKGAKEMGKSTAKITAGLSQTGDAATAAGAKAKKSGEDMDQSWRKQHDSLSNTRYALYDVAALYGSVGVAATALVAATAGVATSYEQSFASVARTTVATGEALGNLRNDLIEMSKIHPVSFDDITAVASLGAQMGVANNDLKEFTETVTMFSAATDVTVDNAAMKLGRIAQLTGTAGAEYSNLASTIYYTGINAVATEGQILAVAEQIATAGDLAGFANYEIIALSSALASLGVAPEAARGSIMRLFNNIGKSISEGSENLELYASVSGRTAASIQQDWGQDSQQVFTDFIGGLSRLRDAGGDVNKVFEDLGIYQVRDRQALSLLLNNMEVYLEAQEDTAKSYKENSALAEGYAIQTETLAGSLTRLRNNLMAIADGASMFTNGLKHAVDILNGLLGLVDRILEYPVANWTLSIVAALAVSVAAWAALNVALNLARGGLAAYATAQAGMSKSIIPLRIGLAQLIREFYALAVGSDAAAERMVRTGSAIDTTATRAGRLTTIAKGTGVALRGMMSATLVGAGITVALMGIEKAFSAISNSMKTAEQRATDFFGGTGGLVDAMIQDTANGDSSIQKFTTTIERNETTLSKWGQQLQNAAGDQTTLGEAAYDTNAVMDEQVILLGKLTEAAILDLVIGQITDAWVEHGEALTAVGFDIDTYLAKAAKLDGSAEAYLAEFPETILVLADLKDAAWDARLELDNLMNSGVTSGPQFDTLSAKLKTAQDALDQFVDVDMSDFEAADKAIKVFTEATSHVPGVVSEASREMEISSARAKILGEDFDEAGEGVGDFSSELDSLTKKIKEFNSTASTEIALADMFYDIGESLYKNGLEFDLFSQGGIANMQMLEKTINQLATAAGDDSALFVGNVMQLMAGLEAQGVQVGQEFDWVYQGLTDLVGPEYGINLNTAAARQNAINLINDLIAAQRQIMALNNVSGVWNTDMSSDQIAKMAFEYNKAEAKLTSLQGLQQGLAKAVDQTAPAVQNIARGYDNAATNANKTSKGADKTAKSTKAAADQAKRLAAEMRTTNDYVSDLSGVFREVNDLVFGLGAANRGVSQTFKDIREEFTKTASDLQLELFVFDRTEARDSISKLFLDLEQAARDAQREVRDSIQAVQDAQARLKGLNAEGSTLQYQLMVAKALGTSERIAEIEAKIAQNSADRTDAANKVTDALARQKKAQEGLGTSTSKDTSQDIKNRDNLRKLASEYMNYADLLREAGVGNSEISKYVEQAGKDFLAQGEALGFSDKQLAVYSAGISASSGAIDANSKSLSRNGDKLEDLYRSHVSAVEAFAATGASQKEVAEFAKRSEKQFFEQAKQLGFNIRELDKFRLAWSGLHQVIKQIPSQVTIRSNVQNPSSAALQKFFTEWNNKQLNLKTSVDAKPATNWKKNNTGGRGLSYPINTAVRATMDQNSAAKAARGMLLIAQLSQRIATITNLMRNPSLSNVLKIATNVAGALTLSRKLSSGSYAEGGFTGRGRKWEEAGIAHKGEYIFPQRDVDQSTGLPKPTVLLDMLGKTMGLGMPTISGEVMNSRNVPYQETSSISLVQLLPNQMLQLAQLNGQFAPKPASLEDVTLAANKINAARTGRGQG